jgi:hypothetical protein
MSVSQASPAGRVERLEAGPNACLPDRERFPQTMQAA